MGTLGLIRVFIPGVSLSSRSDRKPPLAGPEGDPGAEGLLGAGPRLLPSPWAVSRFACPMSTGRNCAGPRPRRRLERGPVLFGVRGRVPRRQRRLTQGAPASAIWGPRGTQGPGPRRCLGSPGVVMFWGRLYMVPGRISVALENQRNKSLKYPERKAEIEVRRHCLLSWCG